MSTFHLTGNGRHSRNNEIGKHYRPKMDIKLHKKDKIDRFLQALRNLTVKKIHNKTQIIINHINEEIKNTMRKIKEDRISKITILSQKETKTKLISKLI